jgi:hypothetical protein
MSAGSSDHHGWLCGFLATAVSKFSVGFHSDAQGRGEG